MFSLVKELGLPRNGLFANLYVDEPRKHLKSMLDIKFDVDVHETDTAYIIKADLPGVSKDDIDITFENNVMTIACQRKEEKETNCKNVFTCERTFGSMSRAFALPEKADIDSCDASLKNGVLTLNIKKANKNTKKLSIKVE